MFSFLVLLGLTPPVSNGAYDFLILILILNLNKQSLFCCLHWPLAPSFNYKQMKDRQAEKRK